jgi:hypothetical protein
MKARGLFKIYLKLYLGRLSSGSLILWKSLRAKAQDDFKASG